VRDLLLLTLSSNHGVESRPLLVWRVTQGLSVLGGAKVQRWRLTATIERLASFENLRRLSLGETASTRPSLDFLRALPALEELGVEAHDRGFAAIGDVATLRELYLRAPRAKTLDPLRGHERLEVLQMWPFAGADPSRSISPRARAEEAYRSRDSVRRSGEPGEDP
jgi:hypothetical protein